MNRNGNGSGEQNIEEHGNAPKNSDKPRALFGKRGKRNIVTAALILFDMLAVVASYFFALWLRFECSEATAP